MVRQLQLPSLQNARNSEYDYSALRYPDEELFDINVSQSLVVEQTHRERIYMDRLFEYAGQYEKPRGDKPFKQHCK